MSQAEITKALRSIFEGIELLQSKFSNRKFTIDGRLVGDIGEIIAAAEFDIDLDKISRAKQDAVAKDGRNVQIKATFKNSLAFTSMPDYCIGIQLFRNGDHVVIFNGPGQIIWDAFAHRKSLGVKQLSFSVKQLNELSKTIPEAHRIPARLTR